MPNLQDYIQAETLLALIELARQEDLGPEGLDVTSACFVSDAVTGIAKFVPRQAGVLAGVALLEKVCGVYSDKVLVHRLARDGEAIEPGRSIASIHGPLRDILAIERVALNLLTHLSGIATLTAAYARLCRGTEAKVFDTRKTLPGLRGLQKYAVACGGGGTHRIGLYDAVLIKDNHLADTPLDALANRLARAAADARSRWPGLKFIEVEVDTLEQLVEVLRAPVDIVLLDNMPLDDLARAVAMRDEAAPDIELEASGGVTLETVGAIARAGVDRISVGALTHSAPSLDIGLDIA
ncbi:MAG: carboxylating nicotinate-nucleotide diphosphorylase [Planctomycetota bacterium]